MVASSTFWTVGVGVGCELGVLEPHAVMTSRAVRPSSAAGMAIGTFDTLRMGFSEVSLVEVMLDVEGVTARFEVAGCARRIGIA